MNINLEKKLEYIHDKYGNRIIDTNTGKEKIFAAPKLSNMNQYENMLINFRKNLREEFYHE